LLALSVAHDARADRRTMGAEARKLLERGLALYEKGSYDEASAVLREGLALEPHPDFYYALGQSERRAGRCEAASDAYLAFLASKPPKKEAELARLNRTRCEPRPEPAPEPPPPAPPPSASAPVPPPAEAPPDATPWERDGAFIGLLVSGSVTAIFGAVALGLGEHEARQADTAPDLQAFRDVGPTVDAWRIAGGVSLGVGVAVLTGSIVRAAVVAGRSDPSVGVVIGPGHAALRGRF
jgi:tetratricopeptide (TPR) repeat protein